MCWNKESSFTGFIINIMLLYYHLNKKSEKFIPLFITVAMTQFFDFLIYSGYNKKIIGKLLGINLSLQILFLYQALEIDKFSYIIPLIFYIFCIKWNPYQKFKNCKNDIINWNEGKHIKKILWLIWIILPSIYVYFNKNTYNNDNMFLLIGGILLFFSEKLKWGSLGKNWCMSGVILNLLTYFINTS